MTHEDREHFSEIIFQAVQAGKAETSGLVAEMKARINIMDNKIDGYIKEDRDWKVEAQPVIDMGMSIAGFSKITKIIIATGVAVGSLYGGILWLHNLLNKNQ